MSLVDIVTLWEMRIPHPWNPVYGKIPKVIEILLLLERTKNSSRRGRRDHHWRVGFDRHESRCRAPSGIRFLSKCFDAVSWYGRWCRWVLRAGTCIGNIGELLLLQRRYNPISSRRNKMRTIIARSRSQYTWQSPCLMAFSDDDVPFALYSVPNTSPTWWFRLVTFHSTFPTTSASKANRLIQRHYKLIEIFYFRLQRWPGSLICSVGTYLQVWHPERLFGANFCLLLGFGASGASSSGVAPDDVDSVFMLGGNQLWRIFPSPESMCAWV